MKKASEEQCKTDPNLSVRKYLDLGNIKLFVSFPNYEMFGCQEILFSLAYTRGLIIKLLVSCNVLTH